MRLAVELHGVIVGALDGDARGFDFTPSAEGIEAFGANSTMLSVTVPLTPTQRRDHAGRRRNWFAELLPEGDQYDYLLTQAGLRRDDTPAFLARYGRDVAGALQVWDLDDPTEPTTPGLRDLTSTDVRRLLEDPIGAPLANDPQAGKSSLGGVQPKVVLTRTAHGWAQALGGAPTTHILKPQLPGRLATSIFDEEYGSRIARRLGLASFSATIESFDGLPTLVIERYDRTDGVRIHQEDFSQVLGASRNQKYQAYGGVVSLQRIADTLQRHTTEVDLRLLARMLVLAVAVGNLDLHAKNLGLLHPTNGDVRLAPAYDVVPQAHLPNDGNLALAVNGGYRHQAITSADLSTEIASWGLRRAPSIVDQSLDEIAAITAEEEPLPGAHAAMHSQILGFVTNLRIGAAIGSLRHDS